MSLAAGLMLDMPCSTCLTETTDDVVVQTAVTVWDGKALCAHHLGWYQSFTPEQRVHIANKATAWRQGHTNLIERLTISEQIGSAKVSTSVELATDVPKRSWFEEMMDQGRHYLDGCRVIYADADEEMDVGRSNELMMAFAAGWQSARESGRSESP